MKDIGFPDYCITKDGRVYSLKVDRFLKPAKNGHGGGNYFFVHIYDHNKNLKNVTIHRMVARIFIHNNDPDVKIHVNHIDGNKLNNCVENLEWVSPSQNNIHANTTGLRKPTFLTPENKLPDEGEIIHDWTEYGQTDLSDDDVYKICSMLQDGYRVCDVSRMTGYDRRFVQYVRDDSKLKWKHIVKQFNFEKIKRKEKTSPETVIKICEYLQSGLGIMEIARKIGCDRKLVGNIKARSFHKQISENYIWT